MRPAIAFAAVALAAAPAAAQQQQQQGFQSKDFVQQAIQDNIADVEAGRIAQSIQTADPSVRQLGQRITAQSIEMNGDLAKLAQRMNVPVTNQLVPDDRQALDRMAKMQGQQFSRDYVGYVISDLRQDIEMYQQAAAQAEDPMLAHFARQVLPTLQETYAMARQVQEQQTAEQPR